MVEQWKNAFFLLSVLWRRTIIFCKTTLCGYRVEYEFRRMYLRSRECELIFLKKVSVSMVKMLMMIN